MYSRFEFFKTEIEIMTEWVRESRDFEPSGPVINFLQHEASGRLRPIAVTVKSRAGHCCFAFINRSSITDDFEDGVFQMEDEILTVKELSALLRAHPSTIYKLSRRGQIPGFRVGGDWRFRKDDIVRWMTEKALYSSAISRVTHSSRNGETTQTKRT